jgi:hypothetical protein
MIFSAPPLNISGLRAARNWQVRYEGTEPHNVSFHHPWYRQAPGEERSRAWTSQMKGRCDGNDRDDLTHTNLRGVKFACSWLH